MILKLLKYFFDIFIGDIPEKQKQEYRDRFNSLLNDVVKSATEGAIRGLKDD